MILFMLNGLFYIWMVYICYEEIDGYILCN